MTGSSRQREQWKAGAFTEKKKWGPASLKQSKREVTENASWMKVILNPSFGHQTCLAPSLGLLQLLSAEPATGLSSSALDTQCMRLGTTEAPRARGSLSPMDPGWGLRIPKAWGETSERPGWVKGSHGVTAPVPTKTHCREWGSGFQSIFSRILVSFA